MDSNFEFAVAAVSDRGLNESRPQNEDSYLSLEQFGIFAVADGVGGAQAGDVASQMAMEILGEAFIHYGDTVDPEEIMKVAIERANEAIHQMASDLPQLASMATTVAAVHVSGNIATVAHVGDSRVYRLDPEGFLHRETDDHSVVEEEVRAGRMTPEQAMTHPSRNVISRAVGAESSVSVDVRTLMVDPGTVLLVCTDGITRHVSDNEIGELLATGMKPDMLCHHLKELCYERGAEDNLTAVVVKVNPQIAEPAAPRVRHEPPELPIVLPPDEEETVATARPPFDAEATEPEPVNPVPAPAVEPAVPAAEPEQEEEDRFLIEELDELDGTTDAREHAAESSVYASSSLVVPAQTASSPPSRQEFTMFGASPEANALPQPSRTSFAATILASIVFFALGTASGLGIYYVLFRSEPEIIEQAPPLVEGTSDIQLTALEENRRAVDSDPEAYLRAEVASPQDAVDHYLLGRANLLLGRFFEAKRQMALAKQKLADVDPKDAKTLAAEIAMANAIIESGTASEAFRKELETSATNPAGTNSNANSIR